jgi:aspartyl-tRNA(Asn)/glutamyl-tRNA(Gln) amidotransferase subunit C
MVKVEVTKELVKRTAENARIALSDEELTKFTKEIKEIIVKSFNLLDEVDVEGVEPSFQPIKKNNHFRKDEVCDSLSQEEALSNVNENLKEKGYIKGPKVI